MSPRMRLYAIILWASLAAGAGWSYSFYADQQDSALSELRDLDVCRRCAAQIERSGRGPAVATDRERLADETTSLIESAAQESGIAAASLVRISPDQQTRRLKQASYVEKATQVVLRKVTLSQVVNLMYKLGSGPAGLQARSFRMNVPAENSASDEIWDVELTLCYLVYDPSSKGK